MAKSNQKVVLITGCSTGIGLATAVVLANDAEKRFKVYATMRNLDKKDLLEKEGAEYLGKTLFIEKLDVSSEEEIGQVVDNLMSKEGRIDVLVNNAGFGWFGPTHVQESANIHAMFATNVYGPINLINKLVPSWKKSGSGQAVTVTSIGGLKGFPFGSVYVATKFALEGFVESLAIELTGYPDIRMTLVEPGPVLTEFVTNARAGEENRSMDGLDEVTRACLGKLQQGSVKTFKEHGQKSEDIANVIKEAVTSSKPHFRYMTNPHYEELIKAKYTDLTGDGPLQKFTEHFNISE